MTQRTAQQNRALHLYLTQVATVLAEQGQTMQLVLAQTADVYPTQALLKESVLRPIVRAAFGKESTTQLDPHELTELGEMLGQFFAGLGVSVPWPSEFSRAVERGDYDR